MVFVVLLAANIKQQHYECSKEKSYLPIHLFNISNILKTFICYSMAVIRPPWRASIANIQSRPSLNWR